MLVRGVMDVCTGSVAGEESACQQQQMPTMDCCEIAFAAPPDKAIRHPEDSLVQVSAESGALAESCTAASAWPAGLRIVSGWYHWRDMDGQYMKYLLGLGEVYVD